MLVEMTVTEDLDLLRQYTTDGSQAAFTALVQRHVNLVYSAALRQIRSPHLAEEITQSVFSDLARNAAKLKPDTIITAWLYQVARRTAIDAVRQESRRQLREQIALEMHDMNATAADWSHIQPLLDDAMAALNETDRTAVLLRYFENKSLGEVGAALGTSDDAAQKRVSRAVDQLREFFDKRKVTVGASGLAVLISANAVQAAPASLAATITTTALAGTAVATSAVIAATKTIAMTTLQKTLVTAALATAVGTGVYEAHQASQLREQNQSLQQQQTPLAAQIRQLQQERDAATNQLADVQVELATANRNNSELLKLRGEIGALRQQTDELGRLRQANQKLLAQLAAQSGSTNWLAPEDEYILRQTHTVDAMTTLLNAVKKYAAKHNGQHPGSFDQLTASGDLETTNFTGNVRLDDFELAKDGAIDQQGNKVVLYLRVPLKRTGRPSVMVEGGISDDDVTHIETTNVSSE
jgi:RNA polymerase sigma factor (sigma-70 family)